MKAIDVSAGSGRRTVQLHEAVTVIKIASARRDDLRASLAKSLGPAAIVQAAQATSTAPSASPSGTAAESGDASLVEAEAAVAKAEASVADARAALEAAERAYTAAQDALLDTSREIDREAADAVGAAEARLEVAQAGAAAARRALVQAREASERDAQEQSKRDEATRREVAALQEEKTRLDEERSSLVAQLGALGPAPESGAVEEALSGLRRLRQVKPRPSERAVQLAERWVAVRQRLAALPAPPAPPEWLVTPALAALHEAREALARAEADPSESADPAKVDAVERAHREVLDAEQRVMRKGSRANRRKLEQAQDAERDALTVLGVSSYGEYLQRVAPDLEGGASTEERIAQARAALADAEAVWEELHGGQASPEYTAAKEEEASLRNEALAMLDDQTVEDADVEARLRAHVETVVDTEWAERQLRDALLGQGASLDDDAELEPAAEAWLAGLPARRAEREALDGKLGALDARLGDVDDALAKHKTDAFFGGDDRASIDARPPEERSAGVSPDDPFRELSVALEEAEAAEREASDALAAARSRLDESQRAADAAAEKERGADAARDAVDAAKARLEEAEAALDAARRASQDAASAATEAAEAARSAEEARAAATASRADAEGTGTGLAADAWLLAGLVAARAVASNKPIVVDAAAVGVPRGLRILERVSEGGQVIVVGDDGAVGEWAKALGDRAAIRSI